MQAPDLMGTLSVLAEYGQEAGARLRIAREALGLSQFDAAVKLGVTDKTVGKWERAQAKPTRKGHWAAIEEVYGVTRAEILGEPEPAQLDRLEGEMAQQRLMLEALLDSIRPEWRELLRPPVTPEQLRERMRRNEEDPPESDKTPEDPRPPSP